MSTNLLLVDMPNYLAMDERRVNIQLIQSMSIMIQNIKDVGNLTVLLGSDIIRHLVGINCTFNDEVIDRYVSFLKTLVMRLK